MENHILTGGRSYDYLIGASGNYRKIYSISSKGLFKPFTTSGNQEFVPSYETPIISTNNSGYNLATSDGLNPFGINTIDEDLVWGSGMPGNLHGIPDRGSVRALGHKFPMHGVGFGFDIFGLPAPNAATGWNASGALGTGVIPNITGWQAYSNTSGTVSGSYCQIPYWLAGPVDLRWEPHRKVWTASNGGVYAGQIIEVQVSGSVDNYTPGEAYFAEEITYSAKIFDGVACSLTITGVAPVSPRPSPYSYKVTPLGSGDFCFIVHHPDQAGIPRFKIWCVESPDTESCQNIGGDTQRSVYSILDQYGTIYLQTEQPNPATSSGVASLEELFAGLSLYPLELQYGGLGVSGLIPNYSIFGDASGDLVQKAWIAGTGIQIVQYGTGIEVRIASGVEFNLGSGINTSITQLQGLTTPLSIAQGGTSASTKTFVDNYADQSVSGMKTFYNPTSFSTFNTSASGRPPINFINRTDAGFGYGTMSVSGLTATGIVVISSGNGTYNDCALLSERNVIIRQPILIDIDDNNETGQWTPLIVRQNFYGDMSQPIFKVQDLAYTNIFAIDNTGIRLGQPSGSVTLTVPTGISNDILISLPSSVGTSGQVLMTNDSNGTLVFGTVSSSGGGGSFTLGDATDVDTTGEQASDVLHYDGSNWVPTGIQYLDHTHDYGDLTGGSDIAGTGFPSSNLYTGRKFFNTTYAEWFTYHDGTGMPSGLPIWLGELQSCNFGSTAVTSSLITQAFFTNGSVLGIKNDRGIAFESDIMTTSLIMNNGKGVVLSGNLDIYADTNLLITQTWSGDRVKSTFPTFNRVFKDEVLYAEFTITGGTLERPVVILRYRNVITA